MAKMANPKTTKTEVPGGTKWTIPMGDAITATVFLGSEKMSCYASLKDADTRRSFRFLNILYHRLAIRLEEATMCLGETWVIGVSVGQTSVYIESVTVGAEADRATALMVETLERGVRS